MFSGKLWELFLDSFPKILLPGLTMTIPLTAISFTLALIIAVAMALVQFANVPVLRRVARFYIWIFRGTPLLVQLFIVFYGLSRVGIAPDREEKYNFSTPYAFNRTAVLVRGDYDQIHSMEDLKGKRTANTISSNYAALAESYGATVTGVDDLNQTIELLLSGRIDATLNAEVVFADYQRTHPDANIQVVAFSDEPERVAIPVRKGDDSATLLAAINDALAQMDADGTLSRLSVKYFGMDISKEQ
jgi:His/Glu/Gln/Arg/opine family amino acid ABC transporter permease subunit